MFSHSFCVKLRTQEELLHRHQNIWKISMFIGTVQHPRDLLLISEQNVGGRIDREDGAGYTDR